MNYLLKTKMAILGIVISTAAQAYDYTVKDKYGRTTGYLDTDKNGTTRVIDKYGVRSDYIERDGTIKDKYGRTKGKIEKND